MASRLLKCWPPFITKGGPDRLSSQVPYVISQDYVLIMVDLFFFFLNSVVTAKKY